MLRRNWIVAALVGSFAVVSVASAAERVVYTGGHNAATVVRVMSVNETAPYALTGEQTRSTQRYEMIRIDSRIIGVRPVSN